MIKRLIAITVVILVGWVGLCLLGLHSLRLHAAGLEGRRLSEFAAVAEQIRLDVKRKLDTFIQTEQARPYTDYLYRYVPAISTPRSLQTRAALIRSPLADRLCNGLAYGYFQIDPDGTVVTPYVPAGRLDLAPPEIRSYIEQAIQDRLVARLWGPSSVVRLAEASRRRPPAEPPASPRRYAKGSQTYHIGSLDESQEAQVVVQDRWLFASNFMNPVTRGALDPCTAAQAEPAQSAVPPARIAWPDAGPLDQMPVSQSQGGRSPHRQNAAVSRSSSTVSVRIEPLVPLTVATADATPAEDPPLGCQVYLVRHVQVETGHVVQGFRLDQQRLLEEVRDSADRLMRAGMGYRIGHDPPSTDTRLRHTAILDFGFGSLALGLLELDPDWIGGQLSTIHRTYLGVMALVAVATVLALTALWSNVHAQLALARKKDDFISAVSHELRTPLTSMRMYTEMLERGWVPDDAKRNEYYAHLRHETERLSRLIENVLDFARIQRGRKQYRFQRGDLNDCVRRAVAMMQPCAHQAGFDLVCRTSPVRPFEFDSDAVVQIIVNLVDNAIKYAADATDRRLTVRTRQDGPWALIEVEDHGPGIPRHQRVRVFDAFYRLGDESRRQTTGTGLGLALVKQFAQAHAGDVEILAAQPRGARLRVRLALVRPA